MSDLVNNPIMELAKEFGLVTSFYDGLGILRNPPEEAVIAVLRGLGSPIESREDAHEALRLRKSTLQTRMLEPVLVSWEGVATPVYLESSTPQQTPIRAWIEFEHGGSWQLELLWGALDLDWLYEDSSLTFERRKFVLPEKLPYGYHQIKIEVSDSVKEALLICSPARSFHSLSNQRTWGLFAPLYSLQSERNWGAGDLTDLRDLMEWSSRQGASFVGTLPLFSSFLSDPCDPSPYTPVSRLFWNEFYIDPASSREWLECDRARMLVEERGFRVRVEGLRSEDLVNYRDLMDLKRQVLERLADCFFTKGGDRSAEFAEFKRTRPELEQYARFRAVQERYGAPWESWPSQMKNGRIPAGSFNESSRNYHVYVQWLAHQQICSILEGTGSSGTGLYMDLPLGVHPSGFDVWANQDQFAADVSGGAPPDSFFTEGQDWGFRPLHPEASRRKGHEYFRNVVRWLLKHSNLLRIDHAMGLQRLYWIPRGYGAEDGVYVHYPMDELFATVVLESTRQQCEVIGEDLGTVTPEVRQQMTDRGIQRMYVGLFEHSPDEWPPVREVPEPVIASINTHDTPTFSAFWTGRDIDERVEMGLLDEPGQAHEKNTRNRVREAFLAFLGVEGDWSETSTMEQVLQKWQEFLASSSARYQMINIEDFWLEVEPQNVPGTSLEKPNWKRKLRRSLGSLQSDSELISKLNEIDRRRKRD